MLKWIKAKASITALAVDDLKIKLKYESSRKKPYCRVILRRY